MRDPMGFRGVRPVDPDCYAQPGRRPWRGSGETGQGGAGRRAPVEDRLLPGAVPPAAGEVPGQRTLPGERGAGDMSKPRYDWWSYVKGMIRRYPELRRRYGALREGRLTADYSGMPRGGGDGRAVEGLAIRELPSTSQREYEAVRRAVETTEHYRNGQERLKVIELVLWKKTHNLQGAALQIPCHVDTAKVWHGDFIRLVASYYGLMDE